MKDTVPLMFEILGAAFQQADEETIIDSVGVLSNLVETSPKFLKNHIKHILAAMLTMVSSTKLESATRRVCMAFLLILAEEGQGMIRKQSEYAQHVIPIAFQFLTELQHTAAWEDPNSVEEGDDDDGFENYKFGCECIQRLANAMGGKLFLRVCTPLIENAMLDKQHWNVRHAGLVAIAHMAIGCDKHLFPQLPMIMKSQHNTTRTTQHERNASNAMHCAHSLSLFVLSFSSVSCVLLLCVYQGVRCSLRFARSSFSRSLGRRRFARLSFPSIRA